MNTSHTDEYQEKVLKIFGKPLQDQINKLTPEQKKHEEELLELVQVRSSIATDKAMRYKRHNKDIRY